MRKLLLALALLCFASPALAQNTQCANRPTGDTTNACANTRFVQGAISTGILSSNNTFTGTNIFSNDVMFGDGRPWCDPRSKGAVGDGITNDAAAFRSCVTILTALGGGVLYVPPSANPYCVIDGTSGVLLSSATASIRIVGADEANTVLSACGNNSFPVVKITTPKSSVENLYVLGYGMRSTDTFGVAANPAILLDPPCSFCRATNVTVNGGTFNIALQNSNYILYNVTAQYAYSTAIVYAKNGGGYIESSHFDQVWPVSVPAHNATLNAWAALAACTTGQVVSTGGSYIQYSNNATSGAGAPTLKNYGQTITDGTCTAFLVNPTTYYLLQADSGVNEMQILHTDLTGSATAGLALTNTLATTAPTSVSIAESTVGQVTVAGILATAGSELSVSNVHASRCVAVGCVGGVDLTNSWSGPANITGLRVFNNVSYGIFIGAGTEANITNSYIYTADLSSITVGANINRFNIVGSSLCTSGLGTSTNAITVTAGTSNFYNIIGNDTNGCSSSGIVDNGSGTSKLVGGIGPWSVANGGTGLQAGTSGGMPYYNSTTTIASSGALTLGEIMLGGGTSGPSTGTGCSIANASIVCLSSVSAFPQFTLTNSTADAVAPAFLWRKNRTAGNTLSSDFLGDLEFYGFANAAQSITGRIQYQQTAASSGSNIPGKFVVSTSNAAGQLNQTMSFDSSSHLSNTQATAPTLTAAACNGAGSSIVGTDLAATIVGSTAASTTCTVTFGTAYTTAPNCSITGQSAPLTGAITVSTGTIVVNYGSLTLYKWSYVCHGA